MLHVADDLAESATVYRPTCMHRMSANMQRQRGGATAHPRSSYSLQPTPRAHHARTLCMHEPEGGGAIWYSLAYSYMHAAEPSKPLFSWKGEQDGRIRLQGCIGISCAVTVIYYTLYVHARRLFRQRRVIRYCEYRTVFSRHVATVSVLQFLSHGRPKFRPGFSSILGHGWLACCVGSLGCM